MFDTAASLHGFTTLANAKTLLSSMGVKEVGDASAVAPTVTDTSVVVEAVSTVVSTGIKLFVAWTS